MKGEVLFVNRRKMELKGFIDTDIAKLPKRLKVIEFVGKYYEWQRMILSFLYSTF